MSITNERSGLFGKISVIETSSFVLTVATAKRGLPQRLSTKIWRGKIERIPYVSLIYHERHPKEHIQEFHNSLVDTLNRCGEKLKMPLKESVEFAIRDTQDIIKEIKQHKI